MTLNELLAMQNASTWNPDASLESGVYSPQVGQGWMMGLGNLPGQNYFVPDAAENAFDPRLFRQYMEERGYTAAEAPTGYNSMMRGIFDAQGNPVVPVEEFNYDGDQAFWNAGLAAMALTGANIGLANGLFGGAATAAPAGGSLGTLGTIAPGAGAVAPMSTAGLGAVAAPSLGGAAGAAGGLGGLGSFLSSPGSLGPLISGGIGLIGQNQAIRASDRASDAQINLLREMNAQNRADNAPLLEMRNSVLPKINALMSNPSSLAEQPDYQFGLNEGNRQIANRQAASGNYYSGGALREAQRFGQDYAGSKLDQSLNRLLGVAQMGQIGGNNQQQANTNFGNMAGNALMNQGANRGSGYMGMTNNVGGAINDWFNNWQRQTLGG